MANRSLIGRMGAYAQQARHDTRETTAAGRKAFLDSFERKVDPDGILPPAERARRAEAARKLHMARMAHARWNKTRPAAGASVSGQGSGVAGAPTGEAGPPSSVRPDEDREAGTSHPAPLSTK